MSFSLKWKVDRRAIVTAAEHEAARQAVVDVIDYTLETANRTVPIENHDLENSGGTSLDGLNATVFYDEIYGPRQHEELDYQHDPGRRAKWLEKTLQEEESVIHERLAKGLGKAFK
ncbi:MAG: hypothetical protein M1455_06430 [Actinobacteria bacterium]|nr:hypothetical protein [Actinomycetota bacterium]